MCLNPPLQGRFHIIFVGDGFSVPRVRHCRRRNASPTSSINLHTKNPPLFRGADLLGEILALDGERAERCRWQMQRGEQVAVVDKIEDQRKPEDFIGHRNRTPVVQTAKVGNFI